MTSATLYREAADLPSLLAELEAQHPGGVRVIDVNNAREGGLFGFFARPRVGVHYELEDPDPLADLITAADGADGSATECGKLVGPNAEFAQLLLDMAARKVSERVQPLAAVRASSGPSLNLSPGRDLTLRRKLAELGVPIGWVPDDATHVYQAVETLVNRLPTAPAVPGAPGELIVLAGPADAALPAAESVGRQLRLPTDALWTAGCSGGQELADSWRASVAATAHRLSGDRPAIAVVATDHLELASVADIVTALNPDALWAHVDATCKPSDTQAMVRALGSVTALFVTGAARTASPASVWELGLPVALLDACPPTRSSWAVLLLDKFADLDH